MSNGANSESGRMETGRKESARMSNSAIPESGRMETARKESGRMSNSAIPESGRMESGRNLLKNKSGWNNTKMCRCMFLPLADRKHFLNPLLVASSN